MDYTLKGSAGLRSKIKFKRTARGEIREVLSANMGLATLRLEYGVLYLEPEGSYKHKRQIGSLNNGLMCFSFSLPMRYIKKLISMLLDEDECYLLFSQQINLLMVETINGACTAFPGVILLEKIYIDQRLVGEIFMNRFSTGANRSPDCYSKRYYQYEKIINIIETEHLKNREDFFIVR